MAKESSSDDFDIRLEHEACNMTRRQGVPQMSVLIRPGEEAEAF